MLADGLHHPIGHAEANHDVVRPTGSVDERKGSAVVLPKLLDVVQGATGRIAEFAPTGVDLCQGRHRFVQFQDQRFPQIGMRFPDVFQHDALLLPV